MIISEKLSQLMANLTSAWLLCETTLLRLARNETLLGLTTETVSECFTRRTDGRSWAREVQGGLPGGAMTDFSSNLELLTGTSCWQEADVDASPLLLVRLSLIFGFTCFTSEIRVLTATVSSFGSFVSGNCSGELLPPFSDCKSNEFLYSFKLAIFSLRVRYLFK